MIACKYFIVKIIKCKITRPFYIFRCISKYEIVAF